MEQPAENRDPEVEEDLAELTPFDAGVVRAASSRFENSLDTTLRSSVVPYGYTVTTWAAGAYQVSEHGLPGFFNAFLFVAGAILAFALLASSSQRRSNSGPAVEGPVTLHPDTRHPVFTAGLHIAAVGLALGGAALVTHFVGEISWMLAPFVVTLVYLAAASAELAVALELRDREISLRSAGSLLRRRRQAGAAAVRNTTRR